MSGWRKHAGPVVVTICLAAFAPAWGDDGPQSADEDRLARLEAQLEAQQKTIEALQDQLAAQEQADLNGARIEEMRKQIREVLSEREFRESLLPPTVQAGYDKGFFIRSNDDKFRMYFNGNLQLRYTYYHTQTRNRYLLPRFDRPTDRSGFDWNRFRFVVRGNVYSPDLTYLMELEMGTASSYNAGLLYGWVNYRFIDEFQFMGGVFRVASTRADSSATTVMQFPEYPTMNGIFGWARGTGVRLWGKLFKDQGRYFLDVVNTTQLRGTAQTITNDENLYTQGHDSNPAIVFRTAWQILRGTMEHPEDAPPSWTDPSADI